MCPSIVFPALIPIFCKIYYICRYMDFDFIQKVIPMYVQAALLTLRLAFIGILLSLLLGLICALIKYYKVPVLRRIVSVYIELSRNIGLTFLGGSYMEETFRSALESVSKVQIESAQCIGLTPRQVTQYVILPQAVSVSIPGFCANVMFLIKETSVFSAVALADLMYIAKDLIGLYYKTDEALTLLCISYFILLLPISLLAAFAERRLRYAQFGR